MVFVQKKPNILNTFLKFKDINENFKSIEAYIFCLDKT